MIQIYSPGNENFEYNGDMILMPSSCEIVVELNGSWELQLDHPLDNEGRYKYIQENAVVKAPSFNEEQKFRIYKIEPTISGITAYARPIFMDAANDCFLMDVRPTAKNGQAALDIMCAVNTKYKGQSNITTVNTAYYIRQNLIQAINGDIDQSFINRWGGEILFDNYTIIINQRAGGNYGAEVRYRKNISDVNSSVDMSNVITRIVPVAYNGHMIDSTTPWVDSENIDKYPIIYIREIQYDDVKMREDAQEDDEENGVIICDTQQELTTALIQKATETFDNEGVDLPSISIDVDMVLLQDTEEYKDFKALETVSLGDDVKCIYEPLGIDVTSRVVALTYDCLLKRVTNVTLGEFQDNYFDDMSSIYNRVESSIRPDGTLVAEKINGILNGIYTQLKIQSTVAQKVEGSAFVVEDTDPESPLYGCMVWGTQGLEISTTRTADGRDWDFSTAITAQGIVADAIITGILSDKTGQNYWNLDTGEFRLTSSNFMVDDETVQDYIDGTIDDKVAKMRTLTLTLTNEFQGVATQSDGSGGDYSYCYTNALLFIGTTDITESSAVRWTTNASAGVSGQWDSTQKRYSVTNMTIDDGYVDITATYSNLTTTKRFSVARVRAGQNGTNGTSGVTYYTWIKYADTPTSGMSDSPEGKAYLGIANNQTTSTESTDYGDYQWSLIKGTDGIPGEPGADGVTYYTWIKYADDANGNGMSQYPDDKKYIGIANNKTTASESDDPDDYQWSLIKGEDGKTSYFHVKYAPNGNPTAAEMKETPDVYIGTYVDFSEPDSDDPDDYTWSKFEGTDGIPGINGIDGQTSYLHIKYSDDGGLTFTANNGETPGKYMGQYVDFEQADSSDVTKYKWALTKGEDGRVYFVIPSVNIIKQGANNFYSPTNVTFNSYYRDGTAAENIAYSGRMKVEISNDGSAWTEHGILNQDSSSIMVAMPMASENPNVKMLRCTLYAAGGFTDALDQQTIAVVRDIDNLTQEEVFNILTNNGQVQGIYMQDGRLYLNGQYMQIGKISSKDGLTYWDLDNSEFVTNGEINQYWDNGNLGLRIRGSFIKFFSPSDTNNLVGALFASATRDAGNGQGLILGHRENDELHFGRGNPDDDEYYYSQAYFDDSKFNMLCPLYMMGNAAEFYSGDDFVGRIFGSSNSIFVLGRGQGNELHLSVRNSDGNYTAQIGLNDEATQFYSYVRNRYGNQFGIFIGSDMSYNGISAIFSMTLSSNTSGNYIHCNTNAGAYGITIWASDGRLKKNIKETDVNAIDVIKQIKHRQFDWKENNQHEKIGYIAQELEEINEGLVRKVPQYDEDNKTVLDYRYQVDDERLIPYMTKAIQELTERVEHLESIIAGINKVSAMNEIKEVIKQYDDEEIKFYKPTVQEPPKTEENKVNEV